MKMNRFPLIILTVSLIVVYFSGIMNAHKCCDQSHSKDCKCSNQKGGVGICMCKPSALIRQNWACVKDKKDDSVSVNGWVFEEFF